MRFSRRKPALGVKGFRFHKGGWREEREQRVFPPKNIFDFLDPKHGTTEKPSVAFERHSPVDANKWFHVQAMWGYVNQIKNSGDYRGEPFIVDTETLPPQDVNQQVDEISKFFGIHPSEFGTLSARQALEKIVRPFLERVEQSINYFKPSNITGRIMFELDENGSLILVYQAV